MIEKIPSNKIITDTATNKKPSFYAPKLCVLNILTQTSHPPKNPPPPPSRSNVIRRAYSLLQASPTVPQTWPRSPNQGARVKSE